MPINVFGNVLRFSQRRIQPISVNAKGLHGIEEEVFLSLPSVLGREGVVSIVNAPLYKEEEKKLRESAKTLWEVQNGLGL